MELKLLAMQIISLSLGALPEPVEGREALEERPSRLKSRVSPVNIRPKIPRSYMLHPHVFEANGSTGS